MPLKLILANKAYSSWSLRPWILLAHFKIPFEEVVIPMDRARDAGQHAQICADGKVPLAARRQDRGLGVARDHRICRRDPSGEGDLAKGKAARAHARSLANEMHAGFGALRQACPTNFRRPVSGDRR